MPGIGQPSGMYKSEEFDVDALVEELKENLQLSSRRRRKPRSCPYKVPSRKETVKPKNEPENPYEMLQKLLDKGELIQEAVRRLQQGISSRKLFYAQPDNSPLHVYMQDVLQDV